MPPISRRVSGMRPLHLALLGDEALAHAEEALRLARAQRQRAGEAWSLHLLAEVLGRVSAADASSWPRALSACLEALGRAEALGMQPLAARCHEMLADLWECSGDAHRSRAAHAAAAAIHDELARLGARA